MSGVEDSSSSNISKQPEDVPQCLICHETLSGGEQLTTECKHDFHEECFDRWRSFLESDDKSLSTCPYCRQPLMTDSSWEKLYEIWDQTSVQTGNGWRAYGLVPILDGPGINSNSELSYELFSMKHPNGSYGLGRFLPEDDTDECTMTDIQNILDAFADFPRFDARLPGPEFFPGPQFFPLPEIVFVSEESLALAQRETTILQILERLMTLPRLSFQWLNPDDPSQTDALYS
ncbi:MAG: hypothetical protein Q9160_007528 [Pyrenula sp. 1 TL-2023]